MPYDVHEMRRIQDDVKDLLAKESLHDDCIFTLIILNMLFYASKHTKTTEAQVLLATTLLMPETTA